MTARATRPSPARGRPPEGSGGRTTAECCPLSAEQAAALSLQQETSNHVGVCGGAGSAGRGARYSAGGSDVRVRLQSGNPREPPLPPDVQFTLLEVWVPRVSPGQTSSTTREPEGKSSVHTEEENALSLSHTHTITLVNLNIVPSERPHTIGFH